MVALLLPHGYWVVAVVVHYLRFLDFQDPRDFQDSQDSRGSLNFPVSGIRILTVSLVGPFLFLLFW